MNIDTGFDDFYRDVFKLGESVHKIGSDTNNLSCLLLTESVGLDRY
jgi:hypothetical protein